jgi:hypothetical protein
MHNCKESTVERSEAQRAMFQPAYVYGSEHPLSASAETRSRLLREWYRIGQAYFRGFIDPSNHVKRLNDALQMLSEHSAAEREGFLMGWQSDVYAYEHGMQLSVDGSDAVPAEENDSGYFE